MSRNLIVGDAAAIGTTDRYIYVFMAALFLATAIAGFAPTSSAYLAAVAAGKAPPPPFILHFHAMSMSAWLALLLVQTSLAASGRTALHRRLGMASLVVAPAVVVSIVLIGVGSIIRDRGLTAAEVLAGNIDADAAWRLIVTQLRAIVLFVLFVAWAMSARRSDPATHKRMMILAALVPLNAATSRMMGFSHWLPGAGLYASHLVPDLYQLALLVPALLHDLLRHGRIHRAYVIGAVLLVSTMIVCHGICYVDGWTELGRRVMAAAR